jgi:NAD(P)-dependent dehydrogenase (short-subunit alcohol dehydrogenase family)
MNAFYGLQNKKIIVTGATSGIGRALVKQLDSANADLLLIGRSPKNLEALAAELMGKASCFALDLTNSAQLSGFTNALPERIDGFVHAAGVESVEPIRRISYENFDSIMRLHLYSFVELVKAIERNKKRDVSYPTSVVALSSIASDSGGVGQTMYSASKLALEAVVKVLSKELARKRIRLNSVKPGLVDTEMTRRWMQRIGIADTQELDKLQLNGMASAVDIADLIVFLLSDRSKHVVGTHVVIDGGGPSSKIF